jgi:hypothetical protein
MLPPQAGAVLTAKAKEAQQQLQQASKQLGSYGHKLLLGTSELFDQIKDAIQNEMAFDGPSEGGARRIPSKRQLASTPGAKYSRWVWDSVGWVLERRLAPGTAGPSVMWSSA